MKFAVLAGVVGLTTCVTSDSRSATLATPENFAGIGDAAARSAALFTELGKVLTNPRCVNCHPAGDRPHQGELGRSSPAAGRAGTGWPRPHGDALSDLPSGRQF